MKQDVIIKTADRFVRDPIYEQKDLSSFPKIYSHKVIEIDALFFNLKIVCI